MTWKRRKVRKWGNIKENHQEIVHSPTSAIRSEAIAVNHLLRYPAHAFVNPRKELLPLFFDSRKLKAKNRRVQPIESSRSLEGGTMAIMARHEYRVSVNGLMLSLVSSKYVNARASCFGEESQVMSGRKEEGQCSSTAYPKVSKFFDWRYHSENSLHVHSERHCECNMGADHGQPCYRPVGRDLVDIWPAVKSSNAFPNP